MEFKVPDAFVENLAKKGYPQVENLARMLAGDVPDEVDKLIRHDLQLIWCGMESDTLTTGLLAHHGINPAVMCHLAMGSSPIHLHTRDGRGLACMAHQGYASVCLDHAQRIEWFSNSQMGGNMHRSDDLRGEDSDGVLAMPHLPDSIVQQLPGRALRDVLEHPVTDAMDLTVLDAVQGEYHTLVRVRGHSPLKGRALTALLPGSPRRDAW